MGSIRLILLDTHVLLWLDSRSSELGKQAVQQVDQASRDDVVAVSTISFWEAAMLAAKGRIKISRSLDVWRNELLDAGIVESTLTGTIAIRAAQLQNFHGDPADRFIVGTAIQQGATLVTADRKILSWHGGLNTLDARH
jgi:PIN domain nuclease of toxin-antitoxin system